MNTYEERTVLVFRFIEENLEELSAHRHGTFQDLQKDLSTFAGVSPRTWTLDALLELQGTVRQDIIQPIAALNFKEAKGGGSEDRAEYLFPSEKALVITWVYHDGHLTPSLPIARGVTVDVSSPTYRFLWEVCVTLSQVDASKVRICHREECGRYFFADHGNQFYCTQQCGNKARIKRYRIQLTTAQDPKTGKTRYFTPAGSSAGKKLTGPRLFLKKTKE